MLGLFGNFRDQSMSESRHEPVTDWPVSPVQPCNRHFSMAVLSQSQPVQRCRANMRQI